MFKQLKGQKGFTLIELMIVVAIIGIFAAIAIPNFLQNQMKSRQSETKTNLQAIKTSEVAFQRSEAVTSALLRRVWLRLWPVPKQLHLPGVLVWHQLLPVLSGVLRPVCLQAHSTILGLRQLVM